MTIIWFSILVSECTVRRNKGKHVQHKEAAGNEKKAMQWCLPSKSDIRWRAERSVNRSLLSLLSLLNSASLAHLCEKQLQRNWIWEVSIPLHSHNPLPPAFKTQLKCRISIILTASRSFSPHYQQLEFIISSIGCFWKWCLKKKMKKAEENW